MSNPWNSIANMLAENIITEVEVGGSKLRVYPRSIDTRTGRPSNVLDLYTNIVALNILPKLYYAFGKKLYLEIARDIAKFIHTAWRENGMGPIPEHYDSSSKKWSNIAKLVDNIIAIPVLLKTANILENNVLEVIAENIAGWIISKMIDNTHVYEKYDVAKGKPLVKDGLNIPVSLVLFKLYNAKNKIEYLQASIKAVSSVLGNREFLENISRKPFKLALSTISLAVLNHYSEYIDEKLYNELSAHVGKLVQILKHYPAVPPEYPTRREEVDIIASAYTIIALVLSYRVLGNKRLLEKAREILGFIEKLGIENNRFPLAYPETARKTWLGGWRRGKVLHLPATILVAIAEEVYEKFDAKDLDTIIDYVL